MGFIPKFCDTPEKMELMKLKARTQPEPEPEP